MKWTVNDPDSGTTLTLEGDSPPTEAELNQIFSTYKAPVVPPRTSTLEQFPSALFGPSDETTQRAAEQSSAAIAPGGIQTPEGRAKYHEISQRYRAMQEAVSTPEAAALVEARQAKELSDIGLESVGLDEPVSLPKLSKSEQETLFGTGRVGAAAGATQRALTGIAEGFVSPEGAGMFLPGAGPIIGKAFMAQMIKSVPEQVGQATGSYSAGDKQSGDEALINAAVTAGMLVVPHALAKRPNTLEDAFGKENAQSIRDAIEQAQQPRVPSTAGIPLETPPIYFPRVTGGRKVRLPEPIATIPKGEPNATIQGPQVPTEELPRIEARTPVPANEPEIRQATSGETDGSNRIEGSGVVPPETTSEVAPNVTPTQLPAAGLPDWVREAMVRAGLDPKRPLNDIDIQNPSVRQAIQSDPTLTPEQKAQLLKTGSPNATPQPETPPTETPVPLRTAADSAEVQPETTAQDKASAFKMTFKEFLDAPREGGLLDALRTLPRPDPTPEQLAAKARYDAASAAVNNAGLSWIYDRADPKQARVVDAALRKLPKTKKKLVDEYEAALKETTRSTASEQESRQRQLYDSAVTAGIIIPPETELRPEAKPATAEPAAVPTTPEDILKSESKIKILAPEGATQLRVTDKQGRKSVQPISDLKKGNSFQGVNVAKIEAGTIDRSGKFKPIEGEVKIEPKDKPIASGVNYENESNQSAWAYDARRVAETLRQGGDVLWGSSAEIDRIFSDANAIGVGQYVARKPGTVTEPRRVPAGSKAANLDAFQKTRFFIETDSASPAVLANSEILAHRILYGPGGKKPVLQRMGGGDFVHRLSAKTGIRFVVRDTGTDFYAQRDSLPGIGDFISLNAARLGALDFRTQSASFDAVLSEELLHVVTLRVASEKELVDVWSSLGPQEQSATRQAYDPKGTRTDLTPRELGAEHIRILLQKRLEGRITEETQNLTEPERTVLQKILKFLIETFGKKPDSYVAHQVIERIESAIKSDEPIRTSVFDQTEPHLGAGISEAGTEDPDFPETVQIAGTEYNILGKDKITNDQKLASDTKVQSFIGSQLKLPGAPDLEYGKQQGSTDLNVVFRIKPDGFNYDAEGQQLLSHITEQIKGQHGPGGDLAYVSSLINMVNKNFREGNWNGVLSPGLIDDLLSVSVAESSLRGQMLRAITGLREDISSIAHNASIYLRRTYAEAFGGSGLVEKVIKRMATDFRSYFTETELADIFKGHPQLDAFFDRVKILMRQESGDRLYRIIQGKFKPKIARKMSQLEANALLSEEASKIIEELAKVGITPKEIPGKKALDPMEALRLMMAGKTAERVEADVSRAIANGERNAGVKESLLREPDTKRREEMAALFRDGVEEPTPEMIEEGLKRPEFAHWATIRERWTGYSPTSIDLARKVIKGEFKGTRFADPTVKPADTRIDMNALAKSPEAEAKRVMEGFLDNVRKQVDLDSATPQAKLRVENLIKQEVTKQLTKARQRILDNYFRVRDLSASPTASARLKQLLNAGVSRDPRFGTDRVRQLIKRVSQEYIRDTDFDSLATSTRAEKQQWLETKAQEIGRAERFGALDEPTRDYLDAVIRTHLAERIQSGEERLTRRFLKGDDVSYESKPIDPLARERSLEAAKSKMEGLIRAGGFDNAMVESIASKSAVSKLTPTLSDLVKKIFETPVYRQAELSQRVVDSLVKDLGIDPAQAGKAKAVFEQAFGDKFKAAKTRAVEQAKQALTPQERRTVFKRTIWQKIERAANAGVFDTGDILQQIAHDHGYRIPDNADVESLRGLAVREQQLRELPAAELQRLEASGATPEQIEEARTKAEAATHYARSDLIKRMGIIWSRMVRPLPLSKNPGRMAKLWWEHKKNWAQALNELETFNMLAKAGFTLYRLPMHLTTQLIGHLPTRAIGRAMELRRHDLADGKTTAFLKDIAGSLYDSGMATLAAIRPALVSARAEMLGRGESRNVDRLMSGINALERLFLKAKEYSDNGDHVRATIAHFFAWPRIIGWYISAVDHWQGTPVEYQEILHQITMSMREKGRSSAEIDVFKTRIFQMMKSNAADATIEAQRTLSEHGETPTELQSREAAYRVVKRNIYNEMKRAGLSADDFEAENKILADTQSWQVPTRRGVGFWAATPVTSIGKIFESMGLPISFGRFSNAIATSINYSLMWTPFYKLADIPGYGIEGKQPSTWFRTDLDRSQRLAQAVLGTIIGTTALALMQAGVLRMTPPWIRNKEERDEFERQGHKENTAEFVLPDGSFIPVSVLVGPLTLIAPYLYAGGAVQRLMEKRGKAQDKLNAEAKRLGVPAGKIPPINPMDVLAIGAETAWGATVGNRTASGLTASLTEYGALNAKKQISAYFSPLLPGLPGYQEVTRMEGIAMDKNLATVWDYLVPLPTSKARAVNVLGDYVGNPNALQRTIQVMTSGTYPFPVDPKEASLVKPYGVLFASGYHPPSISPNKGYIVNGELRPLKDTELQAYTQARGEAFKKMLEQLPVGADKDAVKAALKSAEAQALASVGAIPAKTPSETAGGGAPASTGRGFAGDAGISTATGRTRGVSGSGRVSGGSRASSGLKTPSVRARRVRLPGSRLVKGRLKGRTGRRVRLGSRRPRATTNRATAAYQRLLKQFA